MTVTKQRNAKAGCGSASCDCGCNCDVTCQETSFKRPKFFAGQLLTEEDLQQLTDYTVGKNRLHNRYLFGEGVVCGLSVTCHPCEDGTVRVAPGYALDCCGNDLYLPCPEEVDINRLMRDLRTSQLEGYDCGDPCDEDDAADRHYGLYLRYTETPTSLVAPYTSGDPCGQQACENSRICEGYSFELRCDCAPANPIDMFDKIKACVGDINSAASAIRKAQVAESQALHIVRGLRQIEGDTVIPFGAEHAMALEESNIALRDFTKKIPDGAEEIERRGTSLSELEFRNGLAKYQLASGLVARFKRLPEDEQKELVKEQPKIMQAIKNCMGLIEGTGIKIRTLAPRLIDEPTAKIVAIDSVDLAEKYALGEPSPDALQSFEAKMFSVSTPISVQQMSRMQSIAGLLKSWLLDKLENSASLTRCTLRDRILAVKIVGEKDAELDAAGMAQISNAVEELALILVEYFVDCLCLALNPSCSRCDDTAVLLACVTVKDCEVIDICNMSRRFVLSPAAMRYWLPPITSLGDLFQRFCCELELKSRKSKDLAVPTPTYWGPEQAFIVSGYAPMIKADGLPSESRVALDVAGLEPRDIESMSVFASNLSQLSARKSALSDLRIREKVSALARPVLSRFETEATAVDENKIAESLDRRFDKRSAKIEAGLREEMKVGATTVAKAEIDKFHTSAKLKSSIRNHDTIKSLQAANALLAKEVKNLAKDVKKLQS